MEHYKICLVFIILFWPLILKAQQFPNPRVDQLLKKGIENIVSQDYQGAEKNFQRLKEDFPELPLGNIYLAALKIAVSMDLGDRFDEPYILDKLYEAEKQCNKLLEKNENDMWNQYFMALDKGYLAYYHALKRNYIAAFSNGLSSISNFEKCLKADSSFYEAYIAIGTYKYWKSDKTRFLNWLPFVSNDKEAGIRLLRFAIEKPTYNHHLAVNSLIWVYINNNTPQLAVLEAEKALKRNPQSRFFKWALARAYQDIDKRKSISVYEDLLNSYIALEDNNHYNEIVLKHKIAMLYNKIGDKKKALKLCNEILDTNTLSAYMSEKLDERLGRVRKLRNELQRL